MQRLTITRPDDWHVHFRRGAILRRAVADTARCFARAMVMPNTEPPITTAARARDYRAEILNALTTSPAADKNFTPLLALYLTDETRARDIVEAANNDFIVGCKLYPAHATTGAAAGVTEVKKIMPALKCMAKHNLVLQVHGESTDAGVDIFDREAVFIDRVLAPLQRDLPELKIVLEHITTEQGVEFVRQAGARVAATITAHHLMFNRNEMFRGGLRPHAYCLPVPKRERHRRALLRAATGGDPAFFLGSDSAPHPRAAKESECGCAGIYSAPAALELYAEIFAKAGALDKLEGFAGHYGADFYAQPRNSGRLTLVQKPRRIARSLTVGEAEIVPLKSGEIIQWSVADD